MHPLDLPILLLPLLGLALSPRTRLPWWTAGLVLGLLLHAALGEPRWQLAPAYLAAVLTPLLAWRGPSPRRWVRVAWGSLTTLFVLASVGLSLALPLFRLQAPTGPHRVGTQVLHWTQAGEALTVQVWYPTTDTGGRPAPYLFDARVAGELARSVGLPAFAFGHLRQVRTHALHGAGALPGRHPALLFLHGLGGVRQQNTFQAQELASHGYLVLAVDVPGFAAATVNGAGQVSVNKHGAMNRSNALSDQWVGEWTRVARLALDHLLSDPQWSARVDPGRLGAFGHSFGGATAGALLMTEPRVRAALNMDAGAFGQPLPVHGYPRPFFLMNTESSLDLDAVREQASAFTDAQISEATGGSTPTRAAFLKDLNELVRRRALSLQGRAWSLVLPRSTHLSFSDLPLFSPLLSSGTDVQDTHQVINAFTLAFFDEALRSRPSDAARLRAQFPQVKFHTP